MTSAAATRPPFSGQRDSPAAAAAAEKRIPDAVLTFLRDDRVPPQAQPAKPALKAVEIAAVEPVDVTARVDFKWTRWDTGYETGDVSFTAEQLREISPNLPFGNLQLTAHRDGTFLVSAYETLNLLEFRGESTVKEWQAWLTDNERRVRTFFRHTYGAQLDILQVSEPGDLPEAAWSKVSASVGALVAGEQVTPIEAVLVALRETAISELHDDASAGGLGKRLRDHIASTVVISSDDALSLPFRSSHFDRTAILRALTRYIDAEITARGDRHISDSVAVCICKTLDERLYPALTRFGSIGMGTKDDLLNELARVAAFTRGRANLRRLEALALYLVRGADNRE